MSAPRNLCSVCGKQRPWEHPHGHEWILALCIGVVALAICAGGLSLL